MALVEDGALLGSRQLDMRNSGLGEWTVIKVVFPGVTREGFFEELQQLSERELKRTGEFVIPGMVKLVVQNRKARMGRNPATGQAIEIPAKTVVKARIAKQLKDSVLPS